MKTRFGWLLFILTPLLFTNPTIAQAPVDEAVIAKESEAAWIQLFDGETLFGWHTTSEADWSIQDHEIVVTSGEPGFLMTNTQFSDFELQLEFAAPADTNSGVFVRCAGVPKDPGADCLEVNIAGNENPFPTGSVVGRKKAKPTAANANDWRRMSIHAQGKQLEVSIDGDSILSFDQATPARGYIGLQLNSGTIRFRHIRLRPLGMSSIFNEQDLSGWRTHPELGGEFDVEDSILRVRGGSGQLETTGVYQDFLLQLECKTHATALNSGIFFRCIPEDRMMGYESQIHNGFEEGDRTKPSDCGTGGIFRRQNARLVVANDLEWFRKTIVATDNHIAVWVNGKQVSDWSDDRAPHENPRKGCRREAGTIMIQAHDPTTDLSFRNLRILDYHDGPSG